MKIMKHSIMIYVGSLLMLSGILSSCLKDLDTLPLNDRQLINEDVYKTAAGYKGVLAKCYGSLILNGQEGSDANGDLGGLDVGYSGYTRALFYLQECTTDEVALHSGSSQGSRDLLFVNWNPSTMISKYAYYRLYMTIGYCNEFLRESTESKLKERAVYDALKDDIDAFRAEIRFLRAYCYSMLCDLYGSGPFIDETMAVGTIPQQKTRKDIYDYVVSELEDVQAIMKAPGKNEYGRVDQVAAWFLLARVYLNAEVWSGTKEYTKAYAYAKKIIDEGSYPLASDYRHIFLADNDKCKEIIWPLVQDQDNTINSAGTNFLIKALVNGAMSNYYLTGIGARGWGNARAKTQLLDKFAATDQTFTTTDTWEMAKRTSGHSFFRPAIPKKHG